MQYKRGCFSQITLDKAVLIHVVTICFPAQLPHYLGVEDLDVVAISELAQAKQEDVMVGQHSLPQPELVQ